MSDKIEESEQQRKQSEEDYRQRELDRQHNPNHGLTSHDLDVLSECLRIADENRIKRMKTNE